jgi:hypothetical protein
LETEQRENRRKLSEAEHALKTSKEHHVADVKELQREVKKLSRVQRFLDGVDIKRGRQSYQKGRGGQSYSTTFRAYIMKQFVNGAEPAPLHESLKDAYLFFLPKEE